MFLVLAVAAVPFAYDGSLRPGQKLTIRDVNGTVRVRTGDRLAIRANKHAERGDPNAVQIHVENRPDGIVVCVRYPPNAVRACDDDSSWSSSRETHNDTGLDRVRGTLNAKTVNGSIDVSLPPGSGVSLAARTLTGAIHAGGITVERPRYGPGASAHGTLGDGALHIDANTINGSITLHR